MGLDEAVLSSVVEGDVVLRFYNWKAAAVTFGYSQRRAFAEEQARARGLASACLVRRSTGGGVVFHDGDLTFSLVFPWKRLSSPSLIYKNIHRGVHFGLKAADIDSRLWSPKSSAPSSLEKACFSGMPEPMDVVREDGEKILGGALRRRNNVGLYQGSLRPDVLVAAIPVLRRCIFDGLVREFGAIRLELHPQWLALGHRLAEKYGSQRWNGRR